MVGEMPMPPSMNVQKQKKKKELGWEIGVKVEE